MKGAFDHLAFDFATFDTEFWDDTGAGSGAWTPAVQQAEIWTPKTVPADPWTPRTDI
jgi:hypothetical protein